MMPFLGALNRAPLFCAKRNEGSRTYKTVKACGRVCHTLYFLKLFRFLDQILKEDKVRFAMYLRFEIVIPRKVRDSC